MNSLMPGSGKLETAHFSAQRLENRDPSAGAIRWTSTFEGDVQVEPQATPERPFGRIRMPAHSWLALDLDEVAGAHPYLSCAGMREGLQRATVNFDYAFRDGSTYRVNRKFEYDPVVKRYTVLGPVMSGTLGPWGRPARVQLTVGDNEAWEIGECQVGWLRPHLTHIELQALQGTRRSGLSNQ